MDKPVTLFVVADGGHARFITQRPDRHAFDTVRSFEAADVHARSRDLGGDRPGRVQESATTTRHGIEVQEDLHHARKVEFVRLVGRELTEAHRRKEFDRLVLVAPPRVLQELRDSLDPVTRDVIWSELQKDLAKVPDANLAEHLSRAPETFSAYEGRTRRQ